MIRPSNFKQQSQISYVFSDKHYIVNKLKFEIGYEKEEFLYNSLISKYLSHLIFYYILQRLSKLFEAI